MVELCVMVELHKMKNVVDDMSSGGVYSAGDGGLVILPSLCTPPKPWRHPGVYWRASRSQAPSFLGGVTRHPGGAPGPAYI
jgi:hypothetical protein